MTSSVVKTVVINVELHEVLVILLKKIDVKIDRKKIAVARDRKAIPISGKEWNAGVNGYTFYFCWRLAGDVSLNTVLHPHAISTDFSLKFVMTYIE